MEHTKKISRKTKREHKTLTGWLFIAPAFMNEGYPAVMNPPALYERVKQAVSLRELDAPMMITEDFSWYQRFLPGLFFFLGAGDVPALHSDDFHFNEQILVKGADFFEELAEKFL